jgi:hypothetical protein
MKIIRFTDIDKAYAIMAALTDGGMYKEYSNALTFKNVTGNDRSILIEDEIADIIYTSFSIDNSEQYRKTEIARLIPTIVYDLQEQPINLNSDEILKLLITKYNDAYKVEISDDMQER